MTTVALLGNPNVGKTTLFNELTGSNQYVGNWAGVTVEKKEGYLKDVKIVDLPGIYAMDTFSNEEKVSKKFLEDGHVDVILNIVDASNLVRNLYLTTQLKAFNIPIVLLLNMMDIVEKKSIKIDIPLIEKELGVKIIPLSASKGIGIDEIKTLIANHDFPKSYSKKTFSFYNEKEAYAFLDKLVDKSFIKSETSKNSSNDFIDKILLNPILAYPIFILIMMFIFKFTFSWVGIPLSDLLDEQVLNWFILPSVETLLSTSTDWFRSLIIDGIIAGVGGIVVLLPVILALFF
ncbi:ferrous iron transporter B, partial [Clostridium intestinale]|uniref:ferrous iron transporter B n=1 Tax=Clostridium intestinale TaxID=36845 RepID=UPI0028EDB7A7